MGNYFFSIPYWYLLGLLSSFQTVPTLSWVVMLQEILSCYVFVKLKKILAFK